MEYTHTVHPRSRSIKIRVEPPNKVIVISPRFVSRAQIDAFVAQSEPWIKQQLAKLSARQAFGETAETVMIFGKKYQKEVRFSTDQPLGTVISGNSLVINPVQLTEASITREIQRFLKTTAEKYILPRTQQLANTMGISYGQVTLRQQKTRWGSCSSQGNLNFNWRLVHCPPAVIDYVIVHELAHRKQMNHSAKFWHLVSQYDPEHQMHRGWLKRQGMALS